MVGSYRPVPAEGDVLAYVRRHNGSRFLIALNMGHEPQVLPLAGLAGEIDLTTHLDREGDPVSETLALRPDEGAVVRLD
jgi:alpha-glucosidase